MVSYWFRKSSGSSEKGTRLVWPRAITGVFPHMAQSLKKQFYWWYKQELHQFNKTLRKVNERLL